MKISEAARRYARAIYELANERNESDLVLSALRTLSGIFEVDPIIGEYFNSPTVPREQKVEVIKKSFSNRVSPEIENTLILLAQKNRLDIFSEVVRAYEQISDQAHGVTRGAVQSAVVLNAEARQQIEATVTKVTGKKKVILSFSEEPKLLGGMVAQVGGWTFDDGLK